MGHIKSSTKGDAVSVNKEQALEFLKDYQEFNIKYGLPKIASIFGLSRQSLNYHKKKEAKK